VAQLVAQPLAPALPKIGMRAHYFFLPSLRRIVSVS
jgi:hypothetical protein